MKLKLNKKTIIIAVSLLLTAVAITTAVLLLSRGGINGASGKPLPRILVNTPQFKEEQKNFHSRLLHDFKKEENIFSVLYEYPANEYLDTAEQRLPEEGKGDLYYFVNTGRIDELFSDDLIQDLSGLTSTLARKGLPPEFLHINRTGAVPFVPISWYPWGFYYHKSEFRELGLKEPETFEDFLTLCSALQKEKKQPFLVADTLQWPSTIWFDYLDLRMNGPEYHKKWLTLQSPMNSPELEAVFHEYRELVRNDIISVLDGDANSWEGMVQAFRENESSLLFCGDFLYDKLSPEEKEDLGWFSFPGMENGRETGEIISSSGYIVSQMAPNQEPLEEFLAYCVSRKGQEILVQNGGFIPVNKKLIGRMERPDAVNGYEAAQNADYLFAFSNRAAHPRMIYPFKMSFVLLLDNPDDSTIVGILENLEELRVEILESDE